ncbi:MAG: hypothetical protein J5739_08750, partial [Lachnospiraceae bacterium]|nr:hypothetical protein [Lachnospiraceae bacterium]
SERSDNNETVVPNTSENSDREVDGKKPFETSRKNFPGKPGDPKAGSGRIGGKRHITEIRDIEGTLMAALENASGLIPVEDGFVYCWEERIDEKSIRSYYYYDLNSKETTMLGSVENPYAVMAHENMCIGNKLYLMLIDKNDNSYLCIIDTKELTLKKVALGTSLSRYCSMTYFDGFVYYFTADTESTEAIYKYDPNSDEITKVWDYTFDAETFKGDTLLHLATDADHLYVLKAESQGEYDSRLFVDMYDDALTLVKRTELTDRINKYTEGLNLEDIFGVVEEERAKQIKADEIRMPVYGFDIRNGVLYFANCSLVRLLEEFVPDNSSDSKDIIPMNFHMICAEDTEITSGDYCFYDTNSQLIYLYDPYKSVLQTSLLIVNGETIETIGIVYGQGGKLLIHKSGDTVTSSTITETLYFVDKTELTQVE